MEASSSAVNAPHPDDEAAAAFFGGDDDDATPPEDPGDFTPDEETVEDDPGPTDTRTDAERKEDAYQYKVEKGEPVSPEEEAAHQEHVASLEAEASPPVDQQVDDQQARLRAIAQREAAEKAAAEAQVTAAADAEQEATEKKPVPESEPSQTEDKTRGAVEREYIVFHRVKLTARVLEHLLKQLNEGEAAEPRVAFFELHRATTRNDKAAVAEAYTAHAERLGDRCNLAAVSSRSFKERKVEPRPVTETTISIT